MGVLEVAVVLALVTVAFEGYRNSGNEKDIGRINRNGRLKYFQNIHGLPPFNFRSTGCRSWYLPSIAA